MVNNNPKLIGRVDINACPRLPVLGQPLPLLRSNNSLISENDFHCYKTYLITEKIRGVRSHPGLNPKYPHI